MIHLPKRLPVSMTREGTQGDSWAPVMLFLDSGTGFINMLFVKIQVIYVCILLYLF